MKKLLVSAPLLVGLLVGVPTSNGLAQSSGGQSVKPTTALQPAAAQVREATPDITYVRDVLPIFMGKCLRCHNGQERLLPNWGDYKTAYGKRREIKRRIWECYKGEYYKQPMPAGNSPEAMALTEEERQLVRDWVDLGAPYGKLDSDQGPQSKPDQIKKGQQLFGMVCTPCHQSTGLGIPGKFPPLAGSDFLNADKSRAIRTLLHGRQGDIVVNGNKFNNAMPQFPLSDADIANVLTFVYNSFGNSGQQVSAAEVKTLRAEKEPEAPREVVHATPEKSEFE